MKISRQRESSQVSWTCQYLLCNFSDYQLLSNYTLIRQSGNVTPTPSRGFDPKSTFMCFRKKSQFSCFNPQFLLDAVGATFRIWSKSKLSKLSLKNIYTSYSIGSEVSALEEEKSEVGRVWGEGAGMGGIRGWDGGWASGRWQQMMPSLQFRQQ